MASKRIGQLEERKSIDGTELFPVSDGTKNYKLSTTQLRAYAEKDMHFIGVRKVASFAALTAWLDELAASTTLDVCGWGVAELVGQPFFVENIAMEASSRNWVQAVRGRVTASAAGALLNDSDYGLVRRKIVNGTCGPWKNLSADGPMTAADKQKLDALHAPGDLTFLVPDALVEPDSITIRAETDTGQSEQGLRFETATSEVAGLMSAQDKTMLRCVKDLGIVPDFGTAAARAGAEIVVNDPKVRMILWRTSDVSAGGGVGHGGTIFQERYGNWYVVQWCMFAAQSRDCLVRCITTGGNYKVGPWQRLFVAPIDNLSFSAGSLYFTAPKDAGGAFPNANVKQKVFTIPNASASAAGLMSAEDYQLLDFYNHEKDFYAQSQDLNALEKRVAALEAKLA